MKKHLPYFRLKFNTTLVVCCLLLFSYQITNAQCTATLTIQPNAATGEDALVASYFATANTNQGNNPDLDADTWTISGDDVIFRGYIRFDLSSIPTNAIVLRIQLFLIMPSVVS